MNSLVTLVLTLLVSATSVANEFSEKSAQRTKVSCQISGDQVIFEKNKSYKIYDKNIQQVRLLGCEKININKLEFYTVLMSGNGLNRYGDIKSLVYDIALLEKGSGKIKTVRSEVIDQVDVSADLPDLNFSTELETKWGLGDKDQSVMIEMKVSNESVDSESFTYLIKLNSKMTWFENVF